MAKRRRRSYTGGPTPARRRRVARIQGLKAQGLTSAQIGKRLGLAPSTVRDYLSDPFRARARVRQRRWGVVGFSINGEPVEYVRASWKRGGPVKGESLTAAKARGKQLRALVGRRVASGR